MSYDRFNLTLPTGELTDFSLILDLSLCSSEWWSTVDTSDGTKGRVYKNDDTRLPVDWIDFDNTGTTGFARIKWTGTLPTGGDLYIRVEPPISTNSSIDPTGTYGQYNAYDQYWQVYYPFTDLNDRTRHETHLSISDGTPVPYPAGKLGGAYDANQGADEDRLHATLPSGITLPMTCSAWMQHDTNNYTQIAGGVFNLVDGDGVGLGRYSTDFARTLIGSSFTFSGLQGEALSDSNSVWGLVTTRYNSVQHYVAKDGNVGATTPTNHGKNPENLTELYVFGNTGTANWHRGRLDDFQIHTAFRPDAWVSYEYEATNDPTIFWGSGVWTLDSNPTLPATPVVLIFRNILS